MGRKRTGNRLPPFVAMTWEMLNSTAYKKLPPSSGKMLPYFLGKVQLNPKEPEYYRTSFSLTYTDAVKYGCARRTFFNVLDALIKFGFIDPVSKGGLRGMNMTSSIFRLSDRWKQYENASFVEISWAMFGKHQIDKMFARQSK